MIDLWNRIKAWNATTWLKVLQRLNIAGTTAISAIAALNATYPNIAYDISGGLPWYLKVLLIGGWFSLVHYVAARAKQAA